MKKNLQDAFNIIESFRGNTQSLEDRKKAAVNLAEIIFKEGLKKQTFQDKIQHKMLSRMMDDLSGKAFTLHIADQCFRSSKNKRVADQICYLIKLYGMPKYLPLIQRGLLYLFKLLSPIFPFIFVPVFRASLRALTSTVILPGKTEKLVKHIKKRKKENVKININHLGEAILGEEEAQERTKIYLRSLAIPQIDYVSIKISTIYSQINLLAWDDTVEKVSEKLRVLYRSAIKHSTKTKEKFINLDMEEYQDLHLTVAVFQKVLMEEEFFYFRAGIVLQAYLPDSFAILKKLTAFAKNRIEKGGAPIKVRIVKGANLQAEQVASSLQNWPQTPFTSKLEVDAHYKKMVHFAFTKENAKAVNIGLASHNIFDISYALLLSAEQEIEEYIEFEMLEGIADYFRKVVQKLANGKILLYCPVAKKKDFRHAIAYLIRRLDENTGPDNFLRHSFTLKPNTKTWDREVKFFYEGCDLIKNISSEPRKTQDQNNPKLNTNPDKPFDNEPNTDFSLEQNRLWAKKIIEKWRNKEYKTIPNVIAGNEVTPNSQGEGYDPSNPNKLLFSYSLANSELIDQALSCAKENEKSWASVPYIEKNKLFANLANMFREKRGDLIGAMVANGGKTIIEADLELSEAIDFIEYYRMQFKTMTDHDDLSFKPKGTGLVTPPWNFPCAIPVGGIMAALITGNCTLFKPSPEAVLVGFELVQLFWKAGVPKKVLQFINCKDEPTGTELIKDKRVNFVILTGGTETAKAFLKMRPSLDLSAETGGKNAMIITSLADHDLAVKDLIFSAFGHSGQKCSAASLAIIEKEIYDDPSFLKQLKDTAESMTVGSSWDLKTKIGPVITKPSEKLLKGLTTLEKGQQWLLKPRQIHPNLWTPGIILGVKPGSFLQKTELFGPVLGLVRAKNLSHAIEIANSTQYGLTSGIQSLDLREQGIWLNKIEAGNCYINRTVTGAIVQRQPFGGCKLSSFGGGSKAGGPNYLREFMEITQVKLPKGKHPVSKKVNNLTALIDQIDLSKEELGDYYDSIANYSYHYKNFQTTHDVSKLVGQDNLLAYLPRKGLCLRFDKNSPVIDSLKVLAAALTCKCNFEISFEANSTIDWKMIKPKIRTICESDKEFIKRVSAGLTQRIRLITKASAELKEAAASHGTFIFDGPILSNGRFELLHYLREVSISIDYHRYGNLGERESEIRKPIA